VADGRGAFAGSGMVRRALQECGIKIGDMMPSEERRITR
jgi:hypothetical protein